MIAPFIARHIIDEGFDFIIGSGERVLIGPRFIFPENMRDGLIETSAMRAEAVLREVCSSSDGFIQSGIIRVLNLLQGIGSWWSSQDKDSLILRALNLLRSGQLIIVITEAPPRMSREQALTDLQKATSGLASGMLTLPVTGLVIPAAQGGMEFGSALATVDAEETDFTALDSLTKKVAYVIKRSRRYMAGALKKQVEALFSKTMLIILIIMIAALVALWLFPPAGATATAILVAIGYAMIGWTIFDLCRNLWTLFGMITEATSMDDLDKAARKFADIVATFSIDVILSICAFGVGKLAKGIKKTADAGRKIADDVADARRARKKKKKPKTREEIIDDRIKTDPKFARDIKKDPDAVHGYSPKTEAEGSKVPEFGIDYTNSDQVAAAAVRRKKYMNDLDKKREGLAKEIEEVKRNGGSLSDLAAEKVAKRNQGRIDTYLRKNDLENLQKVRRRNKKRYGHKDGPTVEWLLNDGKSLEEIIYSSTKYDDATSTVFGLWP